MSLKVSVSSSDPLNVACDVAVIGVPEGASLRAGLLGALGKALGPSFGKTVRRHEFSGKKDQALDFPTNGALKAGRVLLIGLGPDPLTSSDLRLFAAKGTRFANGQRASSVAIELLPGIESAERAAAEGAVLGAYRFTKYLTGDRAPSHEISRVSLCAGDRVTREQREEAELGQRVGEAVTIARDLINEPPNELYPEAFAKYCAAMCKDRGLKCTVMDENWLRKKGMNLFIAVGQGSVRPPRMIHMTYTPKGTKPKKKIVFVGKGLTFDTGGICIKPAAGMEEMKGDMGGAANVAALMAAVAELQPDVEVHGLIGSAENMPDGNAYRPGDIFKSYEGKSVEVINTDAEGRLVLADVLTYAAELEPDVIIDNATLTGACVVALGPTVSAFYSNRSELAAAMGLAAKAAGESMWHMPLVEELRDGLKTEWADLKHVADRWGGSITAALFLREFVRDTPWIHVDVAGPSLASRAYGLYSKGGTGHGVLTYLRLLSHLADG